MAIKYVHVRHSNGAEDMVPESTAAAREAAGQLVILDPTPGRYRKFPAPAEPAEEQVSEVEADRPKRTRTATPVAVDPAPVGAPDEPEEATK